jgi:hypothetical protein
MDMEASFAKRLAKLSSRHRAELRELLGNPPNPANVPEAFWVKVERELEEEAAVALYLLFISSANFHASGDVSGQGLHSSTALLLNRQADTYSSRRASELATGYGLTSRDRFGTLADKIGEATRNDTIITRSELELDLTKIFGPARDASVAMTETTKGQTAGGDAGIEITVGKSLQDIWRIKDGTACETCKSVNGQPRSEWEKRFPTGPGDDVHPNCRCYLEYANKSRAGSAAA